MRTSLVLLLTAIACAAPLRQDVTVPTPAVPFESFDEATARCERTLLCVDPAAAEEWSPPPPPRPCQGIHTNERVAVKRMKWICVCRCESAESCGPGETCQPRQLGYFEGRQACGPAIDAGVPTLRLPPEQPCLAP